MFISQTTDFHFANYRFSFRKLQILISQTTDFHFANYRFPFRKLQIPISQTTDFHFVNYRFPFRFVPFRFANYSKPSVSTSRNREERLTLFNPRRQGRGASEKDSKRRKTDVTKSKPWTAHFLCLADRFCLYDLAFLMLILGMFDYSSFT